MALGALGVVYGDIGTSPLYAVNQIFFGRAPIPAAPDQVFGCTSLLLWSLTLIVAVKYLVFVLRADNDGEGGTFALYGLLHRYRRTGIGALLWLLMLAAGLLFGEGVITPAISVLSAVEGLRIATPLFDRLVIPITLFILFGLFAIQHQGTARVGRLFGPIVICWFLTIAVLGGAQVLRTPAILLAAAPWRGVAFLWHSGLHKSLLVLGGVVLAVTGTEALFADLGHFGKLPIRLSFLSLVYPALLLNYLGQGAYLLTGQPVAGGNVFYSLVPRGLLYPMVALATASTIIASQALISGAFSLAVQAVRLGLLPRLKIVHTHTEQEGQIYSPFVNWALFCGCVLLCLGFGSSTALASAYGLAVSGVMLSTSIAMMALSHLYWGFGRTRSAVTFGLFAVLDAAFLLANSLKFLEGGFIPLSLGLILFGVMVTWRWGRKATAQAYAVKQTMKMKELLELKQTATSFIERNLVMMAPTPLRSEEDHTPALLQLFWDRYGILPRNLFFVEVVHKKVPYIHDERYHVTVFQQDRDGHKGHVISVTVAFGFMEEPDVERVLADLAGHRQIDLPKDPHRWLVHVSMEKLRPARRLSFVERLRFRLFSLLRQISQPAHFYYGLGNEVNLSMEIFPVKIR
jgi:KUP system potassium uptake protein